VKVHELIEKLREMPQDAGVTLETCCDSLNLESVSFSEYGGETVYLEADGRIG
jgi:hypothetical protein